MPFPDLYLILEKDFTQIGASAHVYLETLTLGAQDPDTGWYERTFAETDLQALIIPKGLSFLALKHGLHVQYDAIAVTKTVALEGDELYDQNGDRYVINSVVAHRILDQVQFYEHQMQLQMPSERRMESGSYLKWTGPNSIFERAKRFYEQNGIASSTATLYPLTLNNQSSVTGWFQRVTLSTTPITLLVVQGPGKLLVNKIGFYSQYQVTGFTLDNVVEGDSVGTPDGSKYLVKTVTPQLLGDRVAFFTLELAPTKLVPCRCPPEGEEECVNGSLDGIDCFLNQNSNTTWGDLPITIDLVPNQNVDDIQSFFKFEIRGFTPITFDEVPITAEIEFQYTDATSTYATITPTSFNLGGYGRPSIDLRPYLSLGKVLDKIIITVVDVASYGWWAWDIQAWKGYWNMWDPWGNGWEYRGDIFHDDSPAMQLDGPGCDEAGIMTQNYVDMDENFDVSCITELSFWMYGLQPTDVHGKVLLEAYYEDEYGVEYVPSESFECDFEVWEKKYFNLNSFVGGPGSRLKKIIFTGQISCIIDDISLVC
jgi:hypothetical protein